MALFLLYALRELFAVALEVVLSVKQILQAELHDLKGFVDFKRRLGDLFLSLTVSLQIYISDIVHDEVQRPQVSLGRSYLKHSSHISSFDVAPVDPAVLRVLEDWLEITEGRLHLNKSIALGAIQCFLLSGLSQLIKSIDIHFRGEM